MILKNVNIEKIERLKANERIQELLLVVEKLKHKQQEQKEKIVYILGFMIRKKNYRITKKRLYIWTI
jgi:hypothetical protein